jgi:twinkle protein
MDKYRQLGINVGGKTSGQTKTKCPQCSHTRKKNKNEPCLSVNLDEGVYKCHHCNWSGGINEEKIEYKRPTKERIAKATNPLYEAFEKRSIGKGVVDRNKIASSKDGKLIVFPYIRGGELINLKTRGLEDKEFRQSAGAEPIMFNYDSCIGQKEIIVTEGEFDAMSWEVAGIQSVTSVNQGAPNESDTNVEKKLQCITNCYELFEEAEVIYLGADNDANGRRLNKELARRFGHEKCKTIDYSPYKDANEVLIKEGAEELLRLKNEAEDVRIDGVFSLNDMKKSMMDRYRNGKPRGETTHIDLIDSAWTWKLGEVTVWTGYNGEGKSIFLQYLAIAKAYWDGWKGAWFSPENSPIEDFFDDIIETFVGKSCDKHYENATHYMNEAEYSAAMKFVNGHFISILPDEDFTLENLFEKAEYLVKKQGIRILVIDPYNWVEHIMRPGEREDLYISRFMAKLKSFAVKHNLSIHLVAHQVTPSKTNAGTYPRPSKYTIKGGGTFSDKTDNVNFVWRPEMAIDIMNTEVVFGSQKIKKQKLVGIPQDIMGIDFDRQKNRYIFKGEDPFAAIDKDRLGVQSEIIEEDPFERQPDLPFGNVEELWSQHNND